MMGKKFLAVSSLCCLIGLTSCAVDVLKAARSGSIAEVEKALSHGNNVNKRDKEGSTPLIIAAKYGDVGIVHTLVKKGADLKAKNKDGYDALLALSNYSMLGPASMEPSKKTQEPTGITTEGHLKTAEYLISQGVDVNTKAPDGSTALILATRLNKTRLAKLLISKGADVNAVDQQGYTALIIAASRGYRDLICPLVRNGADKNAQNREGNTALQYAEKKDDQDIVQLLNNPCPKEVSEIPVKSVDKKITQTLLIEKLIESLRDQDSTTRCDSARRLGELKDKLAVVPLITAVADEHPYVRRRAAFALGEIRDLRAVEPLIKALTDEDSFVQKYSLEALEKITGLQFGGDQKKWQEWWNQQIRQN